MTEYRFFVDEIIDIDCYGHLIVIHRHNPEAITELKNIRGNRVQRSLHIKIQLSAPFVGIPDHGLIGIILL